jgi:hypothetical protein
VHYQRAHEADFVVGDVPVGVYAHDWRVMPVPQWLDVMGGREIATDMKLEDIELTSPAPLLVLSKPEFEEVVKSALRHFTRPSALASNPLLRSRLVIERAGGEPTPEVLKALLREAVDQLKTPKDLKLQRAVWHTYFEPAPTQEAAAELLGLPFNTYRYQLANGVARVTEWLWEGEVG